MTVDFFSNGRYALVDAYYRNIWYNTYDHTIAHSIRQTFWPKIQMLVFDLETFPEFTETLVDSNVCFDWQIINNNKCIMVGKLIKDSDYINKTYSYQDADVKLLNQPVVDHPLSLERRKDIQYQIYMYYHLLGRLVYAKISVVDDEFISELNKIFQIEIHTEVIQNKLYQLAEKYLKISPLLSGVILYFLKKNYE